MAQGTMKAPQYLYVKTFTKSVGKTYSDHAGGNQRIDISSENARPLGVVGVEGSGTAKFSIFDHCLATNMQEAVVYYRNDSGDSAVLNSIMVHVLFIRE